MFDEIYLESDEEVTSAIEKIKKSKKDSVVLSLPSHSQLGQSVVNLKLIFKQAQKEGKEIALVSNDATTRNLAERVGFKAFGAVKEVVFDTPKKSAKAAEEKPKETKEVKEPKKDKEKAEEPLPEETPEEAAALEAAGFTSQAVAETVTEDVEAPGETTRDDAKDADSGDEPTDTLEPVAVTSDNGKESPSRMIPSRGNLRFYRQPKKKVWVKPLLIGVVTLLVVGIVVALFLPQATIAVTAAANPLQESISTVVDTEATAVDSEKVVLPGKVVTLNHDTKIGAKTSGKKDVGTKASGDVTLVNEWDSNTHSFDAGTTITSKNGNNYVLTTDVTVPGATSSVVGGKPVVTPGKKAASVIAAESGDGYNIAATTFTIPSLSKAQQEKIYATSSATFTGGTSKIVSVVTLADISKLTDSAKTLNKDEAVAKIKADNPNVLIVDGAIQTVSQTPTPSVIAGQEADSVEVTVKGSYKVITFTQSDLKQLLEKALANKVPQGQSLVTTADGKDIDTSQFELVSATDTKLELTNNVKAFTVTQFDEGAMRRSLIGASQSEVSGNVDKYLELKEAKVTVTPSWWPRLPLLSRNINVTINYVSQ